MALVDSSKKEINFKIVYYGPARSGKTTSIQQLQAMVQSKKKSKVRPDNKTEKTIFFDFLALASESIGGYKTHFQVYTVPGQILYEASRKTLLKGVDGIIFVADSQIDKLQENLRSFDELMNILQQMGYGPQDIPIVVQYNKRDLPDVPPIEELRRAVNTLHVPDFEAVASKGEGVLDAFKECVKQVVLTLKNV